MSERAGRHEKGTSTMIHLHPDAWLIGRHDLQEERNQMHRAAIREAKLATECRNRLAEVARSADPGRRAAMAHAGSASNVDLAACCA